MKIVPLDMSVLKQPGELSRPEYFRVTSIMALPGRGDSISNAQHTDVERMHQFHLAVGVLQTSPYNPPSLSPLLRCFDSGELSRGLVVHRSSPQAGVLQL